MQKSLAVLATGRKSSLVMADQIRHIFPHDAVAVSSFCLADLSSSSNLPVKTDLALISCKRTVDVLSAFIPPSVPTIIARRTLRLDVLDKLIALTPGTKTLLVTKTEIGTEEALETIDEMGLLNISVHSFLTDDYDVCSSITTILLFDEPETIPSWASKIIDLGVREVELSSLVEIAYKLNKPLKLNIPISIQYLQEIVQRSQRLAKSIKLVEMLNRQLSVVLNNVTDCLIVIDPDCTIRFLNDAALKFIGLDQDAAVGKPLYQIVPELRKAVTISGQLSGENVLTIGNQIFHINLQTVKDSTGQNIRSIITLRKTTEVIKMEIEVRQALRTRGYVAKYTFDNIIGESPAIKEAIYAAKKLAISDLNVLIYGENGTGKELFAHSIHSASLLRDGPFIAVNCAALSPSLLESELFGYEEGAFTGARRGGKPGLIEQANGGTIFFDEIGDFPLEAQTRLLRVIQEKMIMRIGSTRLLPVNARIIAATNKNLPDMIDKGAFRQDLFYRLFVAPLRIPPLRKRKPDIPLLLRHFMRETAINDSYLDYELLDRAEQYPWPGNIRELYSLIQYASVIGEDKDSFKKAFLNRFYGFRDVLPTLPVNLLPEEMPLYMDILAIFAEAKQRDHHLGRRSLSKHLQLRYPMISEQTLRNKIAKLTKAGFLTSGRGRQGTQITSSGEGFIAKMDKIQYANGFWSQEGSAEMR
jgi:sigma-54 dependent transcriptional regulator, acetoin dehydrogenase operon transcriptional activator AcoR